jgi:hypothetical protein
MEKRRILAFAILVSLVLVPGHSAAQVTANENTTVQIFYGLDSDRRTRLKLWDTFTDALGPETLTNDTRLSGTSHTHVVSCSAPNRNQTVIVSASDASSPPQMFVQVYNTSTGLIGNNASLNAYPTNSHRAKPISCAAEELSGRVVVVSSRAGDTIPDNVTVWNGTGYYMGNVSADSDTTAQTKQHWLVSRPGSNEVAWYGETVQHQSFVAVWNASANSFYDVVNLTGINEGDPRNVSFTVHNRTTACNFESLSGRLICFYANYSESNGTLNVFIRNATEQAVNPQAKEFLKFDVTPANISSRIVYVNSFSSPVGNEIIVMVGGFRPGATVLNISVMVWNGTSLGNFITMNNNGLTGFGDVLYEVTAGAYRYFTDNSTDAEAVFCLSSTAGDGVVRCGKWNGTAYTLSGVNTVDIDNTTIDTGILQIAASINGFSPNGNYWAVMGITTAFPSTFYTETFNGTAWGNLKEIPDSTLENNAKMPMTVVWNRYDNTTPVFRSVGTNETDSAINTSSSISINLTVRDNFQLDDVWIETNETGSFVNYTDGVRIVTNLNNSAVWNAVNIVWQNTSIGTNRTIGYRVCANDTMNNRACSSIHFFSVVTQPGCIAGQPTPIVLCSNSCVTLNLAFRIGSDKANNIIHSYSSDCAASTAVSSGFYSLENKFISAHRDSDVLGVAFAGSDFYHTYFDTSYSSDSYLLQLKQAAAGNKFIITLTNGTSSTLENAIMRERDKIPSRTLGSVTREARSSFPLFIRAEYDAIDINNRIHWDGAVRIAIRNNGFVNGLANITLSLLGGG